MNLIKGGIGFGVGYLAGKYIAGSTGYPANPAQLVGVGDVIIAGAAILGAFIAHKF